LLSLPGEEEPRTDDRAQGDPNDYDYDSDAVTLDVLVAPAA